MNAIENHEASVLKLSAFKFPQDCPVIITQKKIAKIDYSI